MFTIARICSNNSFIKYQILARLRSHWGYFIIDSRIIFLRIFFLNVFSFMVFLAKLIINLNHIRLINVLFAGSKRGGPKFRKKGTCLVSDLSSYADMQIICLVHWLRERPPWLTAKGKFSKLKPPDCWKMIFQLSNGQRPCSPCYVYRPTADKTFNLVPTFLIGNLFFDGRVSDCIGLFFDSLSNSLNYLIVLRKVLLRKMILIWYDFLRKPWKFYRIKLTLY